MPIKQTEAFILQSYNFRDYDKIVVLFTKDFGKIRAVVKGARRVKSRYTAALELMTWVKIIFYEKENQDLVKLSSCDIVRSYFRLQQRFDLSLRITFMAEILDKFTGERDANPDLFRLLHTILYELEKGMNPDLALLYFELWLLRFSGLFGGLGSCAACGKNLRSGDIFVRTDSMGFYCRTCAGPLPRAISSAAWKGMQEMVRNHPAKVGETRLTQAVVRELKAVLHDFLARGAEAELKTLKFLGEIDA